MKSIKEKAENLYPDKKVVLARGNTCLSCGRVKRESFEAGANYVLDEIEKLTNNQNWCAFPKQSHKELKELIEQLKK